MGVNDLTDEEFCEFMRDVFTPGIDCGYDCSGCGRDCEDRVVSVQIDEFATEVWHCSFCGARHVGYEECFCEGSRTGGVL